MKKFLTIFALLAFTSTICQAAPDAAPSASSERGFAADKLASSNDKKAMPQRREERMQNASPEERARMEKRHQVMKSLTPLQREEVKKEMERHRAEMKRITGQDLVPSAPTSKEAGVY
jgi:hypothetical protein